MKYKDPITGEYKTIHMKTSDTLPVGTIVSFEGDEIPEGYEEVIGEEARVVISPTEPTTGEEVWIQKGKNLLNLNLLEQATGGGLTFTPKPANNIINVSGTATGAYLYVLLPRFKPKSNFNIFLNGTQGAVNNVVAGFTLYDATGRVVADFENKYSFDIASQEYDYIKVWLKRGANMQMNVDMQVLITYSNNNTYEPYIDKKIHTKNDNGEYEEFSEAFRIERGTWTPRIEAMNETAPTVTYTWQRGDYLKIGNLVFINFTIRGQVTALNGANNYACVKGMPFNIKGTHPSQNGFAVGDLYNLIEDSSVEDIVFTGYNDYIQPLKNSGENAVKLKITPGTAYFNVGGSGCYIAK